MSPLVPRSPLSPFTPEPAQDHLLNRRSVQNDRWRLKDF